MAFRYKKILQISRVLLPQSFSGSLFRDYGHAAILSSLCQIPTSLVCNKFNGAITANSIARTSVLRFSTVAEMSQQDLNEFDLISFIKLAFDELKGCYHCWLNRAADGTNAFGKDGAFLLVADSYVGNPPAFGHDTLLMFEKTKLLQQRYPWLNVFALLSSSSIDSTICQNQLFDVLGKEYITFPILLSNRNFQETRNGACYVLFKGLSSPPVHLHKDVELEVLHKAVKDLNGQHDGNLGNADKLMSTWSKQSELIKEPYGSYSVRSLLLQFPACISMDERGERFFLSDCNHHRVIVFDGEGRILDVIGSFPGFEDGEFDASKLMRPAASYYDTSADCLYIVDSENHAVRRAHMQTRVLETFYLSSEDKGGSGLWAWIMNKLGMEKDVVRSDEFDSDSLMFPWHLLKSDDDLLVMNRSFDTLWTLDFNQGVVKDVVKGSKNIVELCGRKIADHVSLLRRLPHDLVEEMVNSTLSLDGIPYSGLLSSFVTSGNRLLICDAASHRVMIFTNEGFSNLHLTNFGVLGLPYWLPSSPEKVYGLNVHGAGYADHLQSLKLSPGRIGMRFNIEVPSNTVLVEPIQEGCIWRQVRGAAVDVSGVESIGESTDKVGIAQQWYDYLDNLAFEAESEASTADEKSISARDFEDGRLHFGCTINTSPGTSEVIIDAALYLKLKRTTGDTCRDDQANKAAAIADVLKPERSGRVERDSFIQFLAKSNVDLQELVFVKPLHVRIQLYTLDHPKADNSRDIILEDSDIEVNISLR
ncbi:hypothetical protein Dimus_016545 [Dionaea muscipula]